MLEADKNKRMLIKCAEVATEANTMCQNGTDPEDVITELCKKLNMTEWEVCFAIKAGMSCLELA